MSRGGDAPRNPDHAMRCLMLALALLLGGCGHMDAWRADRDRGERANTTPPENYKGDIIAFMRTYLNDPTGVRDALVSEPEVRTVEGRKRYSVCLRYNAKKSDGRYAGSKDAIALYRDGRFDHMIDGRAVVANDKTPDTVRELCKDAAYVPFPELERMTR